MEKTVKSGSMEPPITQPADPGSVKNRGLEPKKGYPPREEFSTLRLGVLCPGPAKSGVAGQNSPPSELRPCAAIRPETIRQRWMLMVAQLVPWQPENAVASVSPSAVRLFQSHRTSLWSDGSDSV
jgi:hypothetical protein